MISNKSNKVDDDDNQNSNDNQKTISETKNEQSMTLDKRIDKSNPTTVGDKLSKKKQQQIFESSCHDLDKKMMLRLQKKTKIKLWL